jgi:hypothetical protein
MTQQVAAAGCHSLTTPAMFANLTSVWQQQELHKQQRNSLHQNIENLKFTSLFSGMSSTFAGPAFCAAAVDVLLLVFGAPPSMLLLSENRGTSLRPQKQPNCSVSQ